MQGKNPQTSQTDPQIKLLLNADLKTAKVKAGVAAIVFGLMLFITFICSANSSMRNSLFILIPIVISTVLSFITYPFVFYFWFGRKTISQLKNINQMPEDDFFVQPQRNLMIETNNALNGYGPANIGFITTQNIHDD